MPILSMFYGIKVYIYVERNSPHKVPHIHAFYNEFQIAVDFDGNVLSGEFPPKKLNMLLAWCAIHEEEIKANYELLINNEAIFRIDPLR